MSISIKENQTADIYRLLIQVAMEPSVALVGKKKRQIDIIKAGAITAASIAVLGIVVAVSFKLMHKSSSS